MDSDLYMEASEAAETLGVSLATLYSYVSRKGLRSFPTPGTRRRRYWRADIVGLLEPSGSDVPAGSPTTRITLLTETGTYYRGHDVVALADTASVEEVAALLWQTSAADIFTTRLPNTPVGFMAVTKALRASPLQDRTMALLPLIERANPRAFDLSPSGFAAAGADALRWMTALTLGMDGPVADPIDQTVTRAAGAPPELADLVRRALVLIADHEFAATTYAVRAAACTGLTPYAAVLVGLVAGSGQREKIQRYEAVRRLVFEILTAEDPAEPVISRFRTAEPLPGYETLAIHASGDSRARALMDACRTVLGDDRQFGRLMKATEVVYDLTRGEPGILVLLTFLGQRLGLAGNELALGTIGRTIGWIAHAQEAMLQPAAARTLKTAYVGPLPA